MLPKMNESFNLKTVLTQFFICSFKAFNSYSGITPLNCQYYLNDESDLICSAVDAKYTKINISSVMSFLFYFRYSQRFSFKLFITLLYGKPPSFILHA